MGIKFNHVSIVVRDLDEAVARYKVLLGTEPSHIVDSLPEEGLRVALFTIGDVMIELEQPIGPGVAARFLEKRGEGMHHISFTVDDIDSRMRSLLDNGIELVGGDTQSYGVELQQGDTQTTVVPKLLFVHPRSANGVLVEYNQVD
jgi:methylmalonyl-CoA/ethylmalonyl-CoA epimerase